VKLNPKYIQLFGDLVIPLGGFFFWDWGLYFILLFYILDILVGEVIMHLKSKKTVEFNGKWKKSWIISGSRSSILLLLSVVGIHLAMFFVQPGIDFGKELIAFWTYEEMGVQQGYLLTPLLAFAAYQQYKMTFLMPAKFRTTDLTQMWKSHQRAFFIVIAGAGIATGIAQFVLLPEIVSVLVIVGVNTSYQYFFKN
jgi:hypothetical protein